MTIASARRRAADANRTARMDAHPEHLLVKVILILGSTDRVLAHRKRLQEGSGLRH